MRITSVILLLLAATGLNGCDQPAPHSKIADRVLLHAQVLTQNPELPRAQALAIKDGRIVAVGSDAEVEQWIGPTTQVHLLSGQAVLPGFIDSHIHTLEGALAEDACSLDDEKLNLDALRTAINGCAQASPGAGWLQIINLRGAGLQINGSFLDSIIADRPILVFSTDAHTAWANSRALAEAGVDQNTVDPVGGTVVHDGFGKPNGILLDAATALVSQHIPKITLQRQVALLKQTLQALAAKGITGFLEANANEDSVKAFCALAKQGYLNHMVVLALGSSGELNEAEFSRLATLRRQAESCGVRADTIKLYADGVMEFPTQTAALLRPYLNEAGQPTSNSGTLYLKGESYAAFIARAMAQRFSIHVHAIGDGAVSATLTAFDVGRRAHPDASVRLSMAHLQLIDPADYRRFAELNVIASVQLLWAQPDEYSVEAIQPYLGEERHSRIYPAQSLLQAGVTLAGGSDWNVSSYDPLAAMAVAISRANADEPGRSPLGIQERVSLDSILSAYTSGSARLLNAEQTHGMLKMGMAADLVVLDSSLENGIDAGTLRQRKVKMTLIKGTTVYQADDSNG